MKQNYLVQAWLVLSLALLFGAALAGVEAALAERVEANKLNETMGQIPSLVPGAAGGERTEIDGQRVYRATDAAGRQVGWVVPAAGQGFADRIEVLIGLDAEAKTIKGLYVLSQKETPGLGNRISLKRKHADDEPLFLDNFPGKDAARPLVVVKRKPEAGANEVQAVTGATISSESVAKIVNEAVASLRDKLAAAKE